MQKENSTILGGLDSGPGISNSVEKLYRVATTALLWCMCRLLRKIGSDQWLSHQLSEIRWFLYWPEQLDSNISLIWLFSLPQPHVSSCSLSKHCPWKLMLDHHSPELVSVFFKKKTVCHTGARSQSVTCLSFQPQHFHYAQIQWSSHIFPNPVWNDQMLASGEMIAPIGITHG